MIGDDNLCKRFFAAKNYVAGMLPAHHESGTNEGVDAFTARHPRQLRHTATTIVSIRSGGTGR
jgi:hypothetical protein